MIRVITFGTFDLLHVGHVRMLKRAAALGNYLCVGVSSDALNVSKKQRSPVYSESDRMEIIANIKGVDKVFLEESLEMKIEYIKSCQADILVMGDDWKGKFDFAQSVCEVRYLPRTEGISTTELLQLIPAETPSLKC